MPKPRRYRLRRQFSYFLPLGQIQLRRQHIGVDRQTGMYFCCRVRQQSFRSCLFVLRNIDSSLRIQHSLVCLDHTKHNSLIRLLAHRGCAGDCKLCSVDLFLDAEPVKQHPRAAKSSGKVANGRWLVQGIQREIGCGKSLLSQPGAKDIYRIVAT